MWKIVLRAKYGLPPQQLSYSKLQFTPCKVQLGTKRWFVAGYLAIFVAYSATGVPRMLSTSRHRLTPTQTYTHYEGS